jgi:hypothetical protein
MIMEPRVGAKRADFWQKSLLILPVDGSVSNSLSVLSCRHFHEKQLETCILFSIRY